jgi:hypothetical protein
MPRVNQQLLVHGALAIAPAQLSLSFPLAVDATCAMTSAKIFVWHNAPLGLYVFFAHIFPSRNILCNPTAIHVMPLQ